MSDEFFENPTENIDENLEEILAERKKQKKKKITVWKVIRRILLCLFTLVLCAIIGLYSMLYTALNSECEPVRDKLVLSATQASATKWLPRLFLPKETVDEIVASSHTVNTDVMSMEEYANISHKTDGTTTQDKWDRAVDGMLLEILPRDYFTAYILLVKDPSRLYVGTSSDFTKNEVGVNIFDIAEKENAIAIINGGEYDDPGGMGEGNNPMGITYSKGVCVWNDNANRTFIGFDKDNRLIVTEPMTKDQADLLGIRDGVCFQNGNALITNDDGNVTIHYSDKNRGAAQRTAIGQTADGTVILLVTDGRSASSIGATKNDIIKLMVEYGAISAGMLDGGSSSLMYYEDYFDKYKYDTSNFDQYQLRGIVNKYKAFTTPRRMPTFFCVAKESEAEG